MTFDYYHLTPVILDDDLYETYGGRTGTSTAAQRQAAYAIAEMQMIREIGTLLQPTTVTGTFLFQPDGHNRYQLPLNRIISIDAVTILSQESACNCNIDEEEGCAFIADSSFGYIDIRRLTNAALGCACALNLPYQTRVAFTAGLPTGVSSTDSALHLALTIVAELALLEIIDPKGLEGGPGDPGVQEWVSMGYGEKRTPLMKTVFGSSARANRAKNLVKHLHKKSALKLGL